MYHISKTSLSNDIDYRALRGLLAKHNMPTLAEIYKFLFAVSSSPELMMPSDWLHFLTKDTAHFESPEDSQIISESLMHIYHSILKRKIVNPPS